MFVAKRKRHLASLMLLLCFSIAKLSEADGQNTGSGPPATSQVSVPEKPRDFLLAAARVNGLDVDGLRPWHILVDYDVYDKDGDNVDSGTYEEFWVSSKQYRVTYTSKMFKQTDVATDHGLYRLGDESWPGVVQTRVRDEFVRPMFRQMNLESAKPEKAIRDFGQIKLPCILFRPAQTSSNFTIAPDGLAPFCFEPDSLLLRYSAGGMAPGTSWDETLYQKVVRFQSQYVASQVEVAQGGKKFIEMRLKKLETILEVKVDDFSAAPNAVRIGDRIKGVNAVLLMDYLLHEEYPDYPRSPGKVGQALVRFVIGKDGHVKDMQFVSGSLEMRKPLEKALPKFLYRPFVVMGQPVEVDVTQDFEYQTH